MIPKIIHHTWVGKHEKPYQILQTWKDRHPDYAFYEWTEENIKDFTLQKQINWFLEREDYPGVADLVRYEVLHKYGGFVAPADSICLNSIDDLRDNELFVCYQNQEVRPGVISPHIGCIPNHPMIGDIIDDLKEREEFLFAPFVTTGNLFLTYYVSKTKGVKILPSHTFIPNHYTGEKYEGSDKVYADHLWGTTKNIEHRLNDFGKEE